MKMDIRNQDFVIRHD